MTDSELIRRFVDCFTRLDDSTFSHNDPPPPEFAAGIDPDDWNAIRWKPASIGAAEASLKVIRRVGPLPRLYELLATSYRWPAVELSVCHLLPNLPADDLTPLAASMFADPVLNNILIPNGFSRFASGPCQSYDCFCFDHNRYDSNDCPVVRINHESVLSEDSVGNVETVFDSFRDLIYAVLAIDPGLFTRRGRQNQLRQ